MLNLLNCHWDCPAFFFDYRYHHYDALIWKYPILTDLINLKSGSVIGSQRPFSKMIPIMKQTIVSNMKSAEKRKINPTDLKEFKELM